MKKSNIIKDIGLSVLGLITEEINSFETDPRLFEFNEETKHHNQIRKEECKRILDIALTEFNNAYRKALKEESDESNS